MPSSEAKGSKAAIVVEGLTKSFGNSTAVRDLTLRVNRGTIYGFIGPNGSGKTTTIRMLCGLLKPNRGCGICLGYNILTESHLIKRHVGYMTQKFSLYQELSVWENLDFVARVYGLAHRAQAIKAGLAKFGLDEFQHQLAGTLSGGWKQRLALAACILHSPDLLLLDEPTSGIDPKARREFWNEMHALAAAGITVLVSTHYMDDAQQCDEIAYIAHGELLVHGSVKQIIRNSGSQTWTVTGPGLDVLANKLLTISGIDVIAPFGGSLRVSGQDPISLRQALKPFMEEPQLRWQLRIPSLEDVFIDLLERSRDNSEEISAE